MGSDVGRLGWECWFIECLNLRLRLKFLINLLQRLYLLIDFNFNWSLFNLFFFEVDSIKFFKKVISLISTKGFSLILVLILPLEIMLLLAYDGDEVVEVLV